MPAKQMGLEVTPFYIFWPPRLSASALTIPPQGCFSCFATRSNGLVTMVHGICAR
jgi:hypothetical protein